jgi:hypothetical protein
MWCALRIWFVCGVRIKSTFRLSAIARNQGAQRRRASKGRTDGTAIWLADVQSPDLMRIWLA